jgi:anti-sigma-K factor RskA
MSDKAHVLEWLPAYALGSLDEAETTLVAEHLIDCATCRTELNAFQGVVAQLALPIPDVAPPPNLKRQLIRQVQAAQPVTRAQRAAARPVSWLRPQLAWGFVVFLLAIALTIGGFLYWQQANQPAVLVEPHGMRAIALNNSEVAPQASGFIIIGADGRNGALIVDKFPRLGPDQAYQLWLVRGDQHTSGALFSVDESGYRGTRIEAPESLLEYSAVRITVEPAEGSPYPTGEQLIDGSLHNP